MCHDFDALVQSPLFFEDFPFWRVIARRLVETRIQQLSWNAHSRRRLCETASIFILEDEPGWARIALEAYAEIE